MVKVEVRCDRTDTVICSLWMRSAPSKGDALWMTGATYERVRRDFGHGSFMVESVSHWVTEDWSPSTHVGDPIHSMCVTVTPAKGA